MMKLIFDCYVGSEGGQGERQGTREGWRHEADPQETLGNRATRKEAGPGEGPAGRRSRPGQACRMAGVPHTRLAEVGAGVPGSGDVRGEEMLAVELKRPKGRVTDEQARWLEAMEGVREVRVGVWRRADGPGGRVAQMRRETIGGGVGLLPGREGEHPPQGLRGPPFPEGVAVTVGEVIALEARIAPVQEVAAVFAVTRGTVWVTSRGARPQVGQWSESRTRWA